MLGKHEFTRLKSLFVSLFGLDDLLLCFISSTGLFCDTVRRRVVLLYLLQCLDHLLHRFVTVYLLVCVAFFKTWHATWIVRKIAVLYISRIRQCLICKPLVLLLKRAHLLVLLPHFLWVE